MYESGLYLVITLISFFVVAFLFSILINVLFLRFSKTLGVRNQPENVIRWNPDVKPSFGGISFYIIFLISTAALSFIFRQNDYFHNVQFLGIHAAVTLGFLMGLFDDSYNTKVFIKLSVQIICAVVLIATGTYIQLFGNLWLDYIITLIWVVGLMNSINMLDNMDGITTIVSLFIFVASLILILTGSQSDSPFIVLQIGMIAALLGFLIFNWHPSKMFMGDTGSQFLGVMLAVTGILFFWNAPEVAAQQFPEKRFLIALMMFVLPISDTTTVVITRLRKGKSPFVGGRDHTTHHLSYHGYSDKAVALIFMGISAVNAALVIIASFIAAWSLVYTLLFSLYFLLIFAGLLFIGSKKPA